ncbi:MAG: 50S ribosomal protein L3 [candidate division KSB1 bacterium]|nr:50S ribosomal protein L3 [candidate division KSB1 bacterium]MDZ7399483.1 50S ribosomal protein L3 [candidate division KSB1 bacterium]
MSSLIGKKIGMTRYFDDSGQNVVVTVLEAGPCYVTDLRTREKHGYDAVQLGFEPVREKLITRPLMGHFKRANVRPLRILKEFRNFDGMNNLKLGDELRVSLFSVGDLVSVTGISKGKGFMGAVKRHHFRGGPKTHGQSDRHRAPGSLGQSSYPSRVYKGLRMAGRMGNEQVTVRNLKVIKVDVEKNLLMVKGAVPGRNQNFVFIKKQQA